MFKLLGEIAPPPDKTWTESVAIAFGPVRWYAILIMFGFIAAIVLACLKMWKRYKISTEPFYWFILIGVPLAIFGANFGSCVLGEPAGKPWSEFWSSFGTGLAIEWGVLFVVIAAFIYFPLVLKLPRYHVKDIYEPQGQQNVKKVSLWMYADAIMPCILIGQFLGRWGNYLNQEVYGGAVTSQSLSWFLHDCLPYMFVNGEWKQPLFLWEGLGNLAMFFVLYFGVEFIRCRKAGDMGALYIFWYGLFRICLEPLRDPQYKSTATMVFSAIFIAAGALMILFNHLLVDKVRPYKVWHTLFNRGPGEVFRMIGTSYMPSRIKFNQWRISHIKNQEKVNKIHVKNEALSRKLEEQKNLYKSLPYQDCVRKPQELIYYGAW